MKTILASLLGISMLAGIAARSDAATAPAATQGSQASITNVADDYDFPAFGTKRWWEQQERG